MSFLASDCSCNGGYIPTVVQCVACPTGGVSDTFGANQWIAANQRRIQNQSRVPSTQYMDSLAAYNVRGAFSGPAANNPVSLYSFVNWNQSSDRNVPHQTQRNVPSHGNSTKRSLTRCRPGALCPGNAESAGVDIKHNSYQRYLLRKKGGTIRQSAKAVAVTPGAQAYYTKYSIVQNSACNC